MKAIKFLLIALAVASCSPEDDAIILGCDPLSQNCRTIIDKDILPQGSSSQHPTYKIYTLTLENNCDGSVEVYYTTAEWRWFSLSRGENNCNVIPEYNLGYNWFKL